MQSSSRRSIAVALLLVLALFATACSGDSDGQANADPNDQGDGGSTGDGGGDGSDGGDPSASGNTSASEGVTVRIESGGDAAGSDTDITLTLDNASGSTDEREPRETTVEGDPLGDAQVDELLDRLPELVAETTDQVDFNRPPETRPRPRPGSTVDQEFPPPADEPTAEPEVGDLEVLRFQPEGAVDLAPFISVTFNQPMVSLTTVSQVEQADVPIEITPELPGRWIWLGTKTARFEHEPGEIDRIPAATNFTVEIPAGTTSANGAELAESVSFEFTTPAAQATNAVPMNQSLPTDPIFFIDFNQRVNAEAALGAIDLTANGTEVAIRLATADEINEDPEVSARAEQALADRWIAMRPVEALPTDAAIELRVGPNVPSAEGPETSEEVTTFSGRTYGAFRVVDSHCGYSDECPPGAPFMIEMSNPIDGELFTADMVSVEPAIPGMQIGVSWNSLTIQGRTKGQTTYMITVNDGLTDIYGQELAEPETVEFQVGDAPPSLFRPGRSLVTLDPIVDDQRLYVSTINNDELKLTVFQVDPAKDWATFGERQWELVQGEAPSGWAQLAERTVPTNGERNEFTEVALDLSSELRESSHLVVVVEPARRSSDAWRNEPFAVWVQRTTLGLDAVTDNEQAVAWVTDLATGEPQANATVQMIGGEQATTDSDGVARMALTNRSRGMLATHDGDTALIGEFWAEAYDRRDQVRWFVLDDRGLYKPGETVRVKGWIRSAEVDTPAQLTLPRAGATVRWIANDAFGNEIGSGEADLTPNGGFDLAVELPDDITLGNGYIQFSTNAFSDSENNGHWHELRVQEFRRPDFEVSTDIAQAGPHLVDEPVTITANAAYFAGGPLGGSPIDWSVTGSATSYSPPNWPGYTFGIWVPWWYSFGYDDFGGGFGGFGGITEAFNAQTDASGEHGLAITASIDGKPRPISIAASATITDVTRQPITSTTNALIHPAELYVGMKGARTFVQPGERLDLEVIVADIDGKLAAGHDVTVESVRLEWQFDAGSWQEVEVPSESCTVTSADEPVVCTFRPDEGGRYRMSATVTDEQGRVNLTELTRWVAGGNRPASRNISLEDVTLVPNAETYQPGDTAEILVQSPFADAHGLVVISRGAIDRTETIDFDDAGSAVLRIPITDDDIPGIGLQFEVAGSAVRTSNGEPNADLPPRPAFASAQLTLSVPPDSRELMIDVTPRLNTLEPGASTTIDVAVETIDGEPVADAELLVAVVDEAVLSLTNYQVGDPLDAFYPLSGGYYQSFRGRASLLLADPSLGDEGELTSGDAATDTVSTESADYAEEAHGAFDDEAAGSRAAAPMAAEAGLQAANAQAGEQPAIELRTNFDALALYEPKVRTDRNGQASIQLPLPDNLTRYRVMVVATADAINAGTGESNVTARLPVTVRPTPPRFANFGDVFEFPVIVQNATDDELEVDVALRSTNLSIDEEQGKTVTVPANDRVEVRFEVSAVEAGVARYQVAASAGSFADAAEGDFPVYTPATAEAFATYGVVDAGSIAQPFTEPADVFPQFGGLEITTSSTAVAALTDAVIYVSEYRYDSSDAFASRILSIVALDDILAEFAAEQVPSPETLRQVVQSDIERLQRMQNNDGGFPYWRRGRESIPYNTVQATHALVLAADEGFDVDEQVLANAKFYLANIEDFLPDWYDARTKRALSAYALHVRNLAGDRDVAKATRIYQEQDDSGVQLDVAAWLWPVLAGTELDTEIELLLNNRVTETPNAATFATNYDEQAWVLLHSDRRTDAIVLDALISQRPDSDLVLKTLNGLLAARSRYGYWGNIQENSFVLLAGARYFDTYEDADPSFVARAWLGDTYAVEHTYEGRSTDRNLTVVPMAELVDGGDTDIVIARDGTEGVLYYRLGLRYAPTDFDLEPRDQGFVVQRTYEAIDDESDVVQNDDGTWQIRSGARVRVRLTMVADSRRTHVALIDPIPAGLEIVNPELATSEPIPQADPEASAYSGFWWSRWFDHQNLRDDRAEAFSTWLGAGSYEYTYVARATTPGTFVTPPARAEQMYEPEVFGRSASTTVTITDS